MAGISWEGWSRVPSSGSKKGVYPDIETEILASIRFHLYDRLENVRYFNSLSDGPKDPRDFADGHRAMLFRELANDLERAQKNGCKDLEKLIHALQDEIAEKDIADVHQRIAIRARFIDLRNSFKESLRAKEEALLDLHRSMRR